MNSKISIIIPTYNEERYISLCIGSILQQNYPTSMMEIIIVDGGSQDRTLQIAKNYQLKYPIIKIFDNPAKVTTHAFNIGFQKASGDFIFLVGSHCSYPENYVSQLVSSCERYKADVAGGVLYTQVKNKNTISNSILKVLTSKYGVGNATFRTGTGSIREVDTVAYGCYKSDVFKRFGFFNEHLIRNQDIEFNKRLVNNGGKIILTPDVVITYYARETLKALAFNNFQNGFWNPLTVFYTKSFKSIALRHYIPMLFILFILFFSILSFLSKYFFLTLFVVLSLYILIIAIVSFMIKESATTSWWQLVKTFFTIHFSYGAGSLIGLLNVLKILMQEPKIKV